MVRMRWKYEQVGRDIVAMSIEFVSRIHNFDAICCVASCDLIIAGCYLAACRLDIPALVVTGGSMQAGNYCGKTVVEADLDAARFSGASEAELFEMEEASAFIWCLPFHGNSEHDADVR